MKKILIFVFGMAGLSASAQNIEFGVKAGLVYNADSGAIDAVNTTYNSKGDGSVGWQAGVLTRIKMLGLYIQPELLYTSFKNDYVAQNGEKFDITKNRIDIPVNVGTKILGIAHAQVGPVFSYYMKDKNSLDILEAKQDEFNVGFQIGAGVEISKLLINARYEIGVGKVGSSFQEKTTNTRYNTESRPNLLNVSVAYMF